MTVKDIFDFLNEKFPTDTACDFDNVGILTGDPAARVTGAVIALDCTPSAVEKAEENGCNLIITHHPVIFGGIKNVLAGSPVFTLLNRGISVISMHTNMDVGTGGVNDSLCDALGLLNVQKTAAEDGFVLNKGELPSSLAPCELASHIGKCLGGRVRFNKGGKRIENVLVCSGSGGNYLYEVKKCGCEALITAEVKHNIFIDAEYLGITVLDGGHFETENTVVLPLKKLLSEKFSDIRFTADTSGVIQTL